MGLEVTFVVGCACGNQDWSCSGSNIECWSICGNVECSCSRDIGAVGGQHDESQRAMISSTVCGRDGESVLEDFLLELTNVCRSWFGVDWKLSESSERKG